MQYFVAKGTGINITDASGVSNLVSIFAAELIWEHFILQYLDIGLNYDKRFIQTSKQLIAFLKNVSQVTEAIN